MATFDSPAVEDRRPYRDIGGRIIRRDAEYTLTTAIVRAANDVVRMIPVYPGERVAELYIEWGDADSGSSLIVDVGVTGDTNKYFDGLNMQSAGTATLDASTGGGVASRNYEFAELPQGEEFHTIDMLIETAAGGSASVPSSTGAGLVKLSALISGS